MNIGGIPLSSILWTLVTLGFLATVVYVIRLIKELIPTIVQVRQTIGEVEKTIQNSQEIIYNLKSISRTVDTEVKDAGEIIGAARGMVDSVQSVTSTLAKPVNGLRNALMGFGYGVKYLLKRERYDGEDEELYSGAGHS